MQNEINAGLVIIKEESKWLQELRWRCEKSSQQKIGKELGYSAAVINQVLKGTYKGDVEKVEIKIRGAYLGETVGCPVIGELEKNICIENQQREFSPTNSTRVKLYRACQTCPHSDNRKGEVA
jgi:hypothetical protein